jgi:putative ABC transport system permease protein
MISRPGEIVIGYGLQDRLGIEVGDRLPVTVGGRRLGLRVVGRYAEVEDSGERAMIGLADLRSVEPGVEPGQFFVRVAPGADRAEVARDLAAAVPGARVEVEEAELDVFVAFRVAFYVLSVLVLVVGVLNLVAATALGIRERMHDIAILKAVGFTPRQVTISIAAGTSALALVAVGLGVPAGLLAAHLMLEITGRGSGVGPEFGTSPDPAAVALAAAGVVLLAAGVGAVVARRAARAQVAEVLRAE